MIDRRRPCRATRAAQAGSRRTEMRRAIPAGLAGRRGSRCRCRWRCCWLSAPAAAWSAADLSAGLKSGPALHMLFGESSGQSAPAAGPETTPWPVVWPRRWARRPACPWPGRRWGEVRTAARRSGTLATAGWMLFDQGDPGLGASMTPRLRPRTLARLTARPDRRSGAAQDPPRCAAAAAGIFPLYWVVVALLVAAAARRRRCDPLARLALPRPDPLDLLPGYRGLVDGFIRRVG